MKALVICIKQSSDIHEAASLESTPQSDRPQALSLSLPHTYTHLVSLFPLAPAVFLQRGNYCTTMSDLNEADMKGLTGKKPGSKMLIRAHSYSSAAARWHTRTLTSPHLIQ